MSLPTHPNKNTLAYYDTHAQEYYESTVGIDLHKLYEPFRQQLPKGGHILDAGCGSGRDTMAFVRMGFKVTAIDASHEMARIATSFTGQRCEIRSFQELDYKDQFDGIWASASLLHVPKNELLEVFGRLVSALKSGGALYFSLKAGEGERTAEDGRFYSYHSAGSIRDIIHQLPQLNEIAFWETDESRPISPPGPWLNFLLKKT